MLLTFLNTGQGNAINILTINKLIASQFIVLFLRTRNR